MAGSWNFTLCAFLALFGIGKGACVKKKTEKESIKYHSWQYDFHFLPQLQQLNYRDVAEKTKHPTRLDSYSVNDWKKESKWRCGKNIADEHDSKARRLTTVTKKNTKEQEGTRTKSKKKKRERDKLQKEQWNKPICSWEAILQPYIGVCADMVSFHITVLSLYFSIISSFSVSMYSFRNAWLLLSCSSIRRSCI